MSSSLEVIFTNPLIMRMQRLFKASRRSSLGWTENIPWDKCIPRTEPIDLEKWNMFDSYFTQQGIDNKTKKAVTSAHFHSTLAQFSYGENAAVQILNQIIKLTEDAHVRSLCQQQVDEEQQHHETLVTYFIKMGIQAPEINPYFDKTLKIVLASNDMRLKIIGLQGLLEPTAVTFLRTTLEAKPSQPLEYILSNILNDEERHIAFGTLLIKECDSKLGPMERNICEDFILGICEGLIRYTTKETPGSHLLPLVKAQQFSQYILNSPEQVEIRKLLFSRCVLALTQMNLLSAELTNNLKKMGFM